MKPPPDSSALLAQIEPMPTACIISCVTISSNSPWAWNDATSALSNRIIAVAGRYEPTRTAVGPAWPRIPPAPSIAFSSALMTMSSTIRLPTFTFLTSPMMVALMRLAAVMKMSCSAMVQLPLNCSVTL